MPPRSQMLNVSSIYENWSVYIGRTGVQGSRKTFATCDSSDNRPPGLQDTRPQRRPRPARRAGYPSSRSSRSSISWRLWTPILR